MRAMRPGTQGGPCAGALRCPLAVPRPQTASRQLPFRRGITAALAQLLPLGETPGGLATVLTEFFDDADDDLARLAGSTLMRLPAGHDDLAGRLRRASGSPGREPETDPGKNWRNTWQGSLPSGQTVKSPPEWRPAGTASRDYGAHAP